MEDPRKDGKGHPDKGGGGPSRRKDGPPGGRKDGPPGEGMERYRLAVGHDHGVMPGNIVGAIANEADIEGRHIGRISIHDAYSLIDLPTGMPKETFNALKNVWVSGQRLGITRLGDKEELRNEKRQENKPHKGKPGGPKKLSLAPGKGRKSKEHKPKRRTRKR